MNSMTLLVVALVTLVQVLAALPWLASLLFSEGELPQVYRGFGKLSASMKARLQAFLLFPLVLAIGGAFAAISQNYYVIFGYVSGAVLQLQLTADFFIFFFWLLLKVWPKGGAVAQAAFREGVRQPMFWLLSIVAFLAMTISPFVPYFTFGEDYIMVKELGYDTIMLFAAIFGSLAASLFVSEEIEGRTAITLMSKPVSRRQFLLGKFVGILVASLSLFAFLGLWFELVLLFKHWFDKMDPVQAPEWVVDSLNYLNLPTDGFDFLMGFGRWFNRTLETIPGLLLGFMQSMVLIAISVLLATRLPMVVNLVVILVLFFLSHLAPVLVSIGKKAQDTNPGEPFSAILYFISQLFDTLLPALEFFRVSPPLLGDSPLPPVALALYLASVAFYGVLYTSIVLLFGLILFEDRDLA